jgi:hypothetical protein
MTMQTGPPVYRLLDELGMRITKSVWPLATTTQQVVGGSSCAEPDYLEWVLSLQAAGHEIGYHNAAGQPSMRSRTLEGLDRFEELFGGPPKVGSDHSGNREAMYWGRKRLSGAKAGIYHLAQRIQRPDRPHFSGEDPASEYFWGDICRERITYWRNFTFNRLNLLDVTPKLPYHDPRRPYVNYWFSSSDAPLLPNFVNLLSGDRLDRLEEAGGVCIMYTHFGSDFAPNGQLDPSFVRTMERIAARSGWVAPVGEVLDHLRASRDETLLLDTERARLERRWVLDRIRYSPLLRGRRRALLPPNTGSEGVGL